MPRKKQTLAIATARRTAKIGRVSRSSSNLSLIQKLQKELNINQSYLSVLLGILIVLVVGVLVFNYVKRNEGNLGPAQQTVSENKNADVKPENLPGKYTVKDGDTLFKIAQAYYNDGYKYPELVKANKIADENVIAVGQVIDIPKLEVASDTQTALGTGGSTNETIWGDKITGDTYTVVEGDWLSKIAGRAYGDIYAFDKIAKANNITDVDNIEPGTVLKIPR